MEKFSNCSGIYMPPLKKLILIMKLSLFIMIFAVFQVSANHVTAQKTRLDLKMKNASLSEILDAIEKKSDVYFFYNKTQINENRRIDVDFEDKTVEDILNDIGATLSVTYEIDGRKILLKPMNTASAPVTQQANTVSGKVTDSSGQPLPGVTVVIKGTTTGTITDVNGRYYFKDVPRNAILTFSFIGMKPVEIPADGSTNIAMYEETTGIDEVVVTGVATGTPKSKLSFTVEKIGGEKIAAVPALSAATSLQGKIAGIQIYSNSGNPNEEPIIQLRGAASFLGTSQPLVIVDGVITEGGLKDINAEDVASFEVLKGAAAAAFYGAKAANGVVQIITKRGTMLKPGDVVVGAKAEAGVMWKQFKPERTTAHRYTTDPVTGKVIKEEDPDGIEDNKYEHYFGDPYDIFEARPYYTVLATLVGNSSDGVSYYGSYQFQNNSGIIDLLKGTQRNNIRVNLDHLVSDKFSWSASNSFMKSKADDTDINFDNVYYMDPNVDLWEQNSDGTPYKYQPNIVSTRNNVNPLYIASNRLAETVQTRFMGGYQMTYKPIKGLSLIGMYSIDSRTKDYVYLDPAGQLTSNDPEGSRSLGYMYQGDDNNIKQNLSFDATYAKTINDFNVKGRIAATFEDYRWTEEWTSGEKLALQGMDVVSLDLIDPETLNVYSFEGKTASHSYSALLAGDYKDKYMIDIMARRDGVSIIGSDARWQTYYRISGAWNLVKDFHVNGIDYLKPRASIGTAGVYPEDFQAQYETYELSNGALGAANQLGNKNLKPAMSREIEVGLDIKFLNRIEILATYATKRTTDAIFSIPVSSITGFSWQTQNLGEFFTKSYELTMNVNIINKKDFSWGATVTWDKLDQRIGDLGRDGFNLGYQKIRSDEKWGTMYGTALATSLDQVKTSTLIKPGQTVEDVFVINNYGWVVRKDYIGTKNEARMTILDENGNSKSDNVIGNSTPDFTMNLTNTINWKKFQFYFNLSWVQGFDMFNNTKMYMSFAGENAALRDMSDRPWSQRKSSAYVSHARAQMVEDASFLRLRELSVSYSFNNQQLSKARLGFVKGIKLAIIARNLFTLTEYSGTDPESRTKDTSQGSATLTAFDTPKYPGGQSTLSGQFSIEF